MILLHTTRCMGLIAGVLMCSLAACEQPMPEPPPPPPVTVAEPVIQTVSGYSDFTGNTQAYESVEIRARVRGYLEEIHFEPSAIVQKGDLLFTLEQEPFQADVDQAEAALARAQADLKQAEWNLERVIELERSGAANVKEVQDRTTEKLVAAAAVEAAEAQLVQAQTELSYTVIKSPIGGRVSRNLVDVGNLVGASEQTLLTTVRDMQPMYVYFDMPELLVLQLRAQRTAEDDRAITDFKLLVGLANEKGHPHEGNLDYFDNTVDAATGTVRTRGILPNEDMTVLPGLFVRVRLPRDPIPNAVLVDDKAIGSDLSGKFLLVVDENNVVSRQAVETGAVYDGMRRILSGLEPGQKYIVAGIQRARPGMPVKPTLASSGQESTPSAAGEG